MALDMNKDKSKEEFDANKDGYVLVDGNDINGKHFVLKDNLEGLDDPSDTNKLVYITETVPDLDKYGNQKYVYKETIYQTDAKGDVVLDENGNPVVLHKKGSPCYLTDAQGNVILDEEGHPKYNTDKTLTKAGYKDIVKTDENGNPLTASYDKRFKGKLAEEFVKSVGSMPYTIALDSVYDGFVGIAVRDSFVHAIKDSYLYLLEKWEKDGKIICDVILSLQNKEASKPQVSLIPDIPVPDLNLTKVEIPNCNLTYLNLAPKYFSFGNNDYCTKSGNAGDTKKFYKLDKTGRYSFEENVLGSIKLDLNLGAVGVVEGLNKLMSSYNDNQTSQYILAKLKFHTYSEGRGLNALAQGAKELVGFDKSGRTLNYTLVLVDKQGAISFDVKDAQPMKGYEFNIVEFHEPNAKFSVHTKLGGEANPNYHLDGYLGVNQALSVKIRPSFYDNNSTPTLITNFGLVTPITDDFQESNIKQINDTFENVRGDLLDGNHTRPDINFTLAHGSNKDDLLRVIPSDFVMTDIDIGVQNITAQLNSAQDDSTYDGLKFKSAVVLNAKITYSSNNQNLGLGGVL